MRYGTLTCSLLTVSHISIFPVFVPTASWFPGHGYGYGLRAVIMEMDIHHGHDDRYIELW